LVDLDGTLAHYDGWMGGAIGAPIPVMVDRVKAWLDQGIEVQIFTARVANDDGTQRALIEAWCQEHLGAVLAISNAKDIRCVELWDDRAIQVIPNTGQRADGRE
jgi:hypothetical protein